MTPTARAARRNARRRRLRAALLIGTLTVGATANQNLFLAIHEISHNLAFRSPMANRLLAVFANLPIGIPYSASFRVCLLPGRYHLENKLTVR